MPYDDPDPTDPTMLVGVSLPAEEDSVTEMAYAFAEEFASMGHDAEYIMGVFKRPFYAGAYQAYAGLGVEAIARIVDECVNAYGRYRIAVHDAPPPSREARYVVDSTSGRIVLAEEE